MEHKLLLSSFANRLSLPSFTALPCRWPVKAGVFVFERLLHLHKSPSSPHFSRPLRCPSPSSLSGEQNNPLRQDAAGDRCHLHHLAHPRPAGRRRHAVHPAPSPQADRSFDLHRFISPWPENNTTTTLSVCLRAHRSLSVSPARSKPPGHEQNTPALIGIQASLLAGIKTESVPCATAGAHVHRQAPEFQNSAPDSLMGAELLAMRGSMCRCSWLQT